MAKRPLSNLRYDRIQDGTGTPRIIALHNHNQIGATPAALVGAIAPTAHIIGLESYKGVYAGREITGFTWYPGPIDQPPPLFFGDSLIEIEKFLLDELDRQDTDRPERSFLVGIGQGGVMALAAALAAPDRLSGVVAVDAFLPTVAGWDPPLAPLDGLPILIAGTYPSTGKRSRVLSETALAHQLEQWGAQASFLPGPADDGRISTIGNWLAQQPVLLGEPAGGTRSSTT